MEPGDRVVIATHAVLFDEPAPRCDVCGEEIAHDGDDTHALSGSGLYMWSRGGEVRFEEPPLCSSCASAIGVSALARWEIEEEEG